MKRPIAAAVACAYLLSGCATSSSNISAQYVSPMQYQGYDCQQIRMEMQRVVGRVNQISGRLDEAANNDKMLVGVGLVLFWPALFALGGTKGQEQELSRLKGEYDALSQASIEKKCGLQTAEGQPAPAATPSK